MCPVLVDQNTRDWLREGGLSPPSSAYKKNRSRRVLLCGGVLNPFGFESPTLTTVLQQLIDLKTTKSKFYIATPQAGLVPAPSMASSYSDESTASIVHSSFGMV